MKKSRRILAVLLCAVVCLSLLASCKPKEEAPNPAAPASPAQSPGQSQAPAPAPDASPNVPPPPPTDPETRFADEMDVIIDNNKIAVLDPFNSASNPSPTMWVFNMIHNRLVVPLGDGVYGPCLATSWDTDDWQTVTFHLRDDVDFHNGDHFTAQDVVNTINRAREAVGTLASDRWASIEEINVIDQYTIQFVQTDVYVDLLFNLSQPQAVIVNERAIQADPEEGVWIGTGAWTVEEFMTNEYVVLLRNENYWGDPAITRRITLRYVPEMSAKLMQLQNGDTDVCFSLDPVDMPLIEADTVNYVCYKYTYNNCDMIGFNMADPIVSDYNFRMAVASALDRSEITVAACGDYGIPETEGTYAGYETEFRNHSIPIIPYDLDAARAYLAESPYNGEVLEIATAINTNEIASQVVQNQLAKIGIETRINTMDPPSMGAYCRYGENQSQIVVYVGPMTLSSASFRSAFYPGAAYNRVSYNNPDVAEMLDRASTIVNADQRRALYLEIQEFIAQDPPYINLFWLQHMAACVKGVGGMVLPADSFFDLTYIYKIID